METEELFLIFAALMLFFDLIQLSKSKTSGEGKSEYGFYVAALACGLIVTTYLMFVQAFLKDDFRLKEVYSYSSSGLSSASKLYASWAGASGSMLFLAFLIGLVFFVYRFRTYEKGTDTDSVAYKIFDFVLIFFIFATLMNSPFERFAAAPMDGRGLNPLLQTFWMFAHPPVVFAGYVFIIFAFILTLARMRTKNGGNPRLVKLLLQAGWLATTLGIAIGGLWAYEVLGWGGYWAWDPVETASLLPWLTFTAYFHLGPLSQEGKSLAKESMLLLTFSTVIFSTALTRGGLAVSVHAFGISPIGPVLLLFILGVAAYFFYLKRGIEKPLFSLKVNRSSLLSISLFLGFWSLIFIFLVCFWGLAFPIIAGTFLSNPMTTGAAFYNNWSFPFAMAFVAALVGCSIYEKSGFKKLLAIVGGALGVGFALVGIQWPTPNALANLGTPLLFVGVFATSFRMVNVLPKRKRSLRQFGRSLLHLAIVITLIGIFLSSTTKQVSDVNAAKPYSRVQTLGLIIDLKNFTVYTGTGNVHSMQWSRCVPEHSALKLDVAIQQGGSLYNSALWIRYYTLYGMVSTPLVITTPAGDIYIRMLHTESMSESLWQALDGRLVLPEDLILSVEINPAVYLVWTGVALMSIGIALPLVGETAKFFPRKTSKSINPAVVS